MALLDEMKSEVAGIFRGRWALRKGQLVPAPEDLKLGNDAVEFQEATVLYADLSGSTAMVNANDWAFAAQVYKDIPLLRREARSLRRRPDHIIRRRSDYGHLCRRWPMDQSCAVRPQDQLRRAANR